MKVLAVVAAVAVVAVVAVVVAVVVETNGRHRFEQWKAEKNREE